MTTKLHDQLPLTEVTFFILLSLSPKPRHGYGILKDVAMLSGDRVQLGTGTLYGALGRLVDQGWIERMDDDETEDAGRPRKEYTLTEQGRHLLMAEIDRLESLVATARRLTLAREDL